MIKLLKTIDEGLIGLAEMVILLVGYGLLIGAPFVVFTMGVADILNHQWLEALELFGMGIASVYLARAIMKMSGYKGKDK